MSVALVLALGYAACLGSLAVALELGWRRAHRAVDEMPVAEKGPTRLGPELAGLAARARMRRALALSMRGADARRAA